jgi:hypothetical protein
MTKLESWLGVVLFAALLVWGTYTITMRYSFPKEAVIADSGDNSAPEDIPVLHTIQASLPSFGTQGTTPTVGCTAYGDLQKGKIDEGCTVTSSTFSATLPDVRKMDFFLNSEFGVGARYDDVSRFGDIVYAVLESCEYPGCDYRVYSASASAPKPEFKEILECKGDCEQIWESSMSGPPTYITKEMGTSTVTVYRVAMDNGAVRKNEIASIDLNDWTLGSICTGSPCHGGQGWLQIIDRNNALLRFDRTTEGPSHERAVKTRYVLLEL